MQTVTHDGRETAYRVVGQGGDGPTTLYVHGSGGNHRIWGYQYARRGPAHPAVALDLSGHGDSEDIATPPGQATLSAYAADVNAVASETGAEVLVGNSLGGAVVFETLFETDLPVEAAVFAGTGAKLRVNERLRTLLEDDFEAAIELLHRASMLFLDADDQHRAQSEEVMWAAGQSVTRRDFHTCHEFDVMDRLDELDCPALAVVGGADKLTPPAYHEYLADHLPDCGLVTVENAAHLAMLERPAEFNDALSSFLERVR